VTVRPVAPSEMSDREGPCRRGFEALVARWLAQRAMPAMRFLVDVQLFDLAEERRYFVAERAGDLVGFSSAVPVYLRRGWLIEDLLRDPGAPNGTTELLVDAAMRALAEDGSTYVTLGLAPLTGPVPSWLGRMRRWTSSLYDFDGLRAFKSKLSPDAWEPIFLAHAPGTSSLVAAWDVLAAFAGGSFVGFGLRTLLRGPSLVLRVLALLLVPWTALLAAASPMWFPAAVIQRAWVVFDVVLALGIFALSFRRRRWLGVALAAAVSADALLTTLEAAWYNAPRAHAFSTWLVLACACAGPTLGALSLWGAVRRLPADS